MYNFRKLSKIELTKLQYESEQNLKKYFDKFNEVSKPIANFFKNNKFYFDLLRAVGIENIKWLKDNPNAPINSEEVSTIIINRVKKIFNRITLLRQIYEFDRLYFKIKNKKRNINYGNNTYKTFKTKSDLIDDYCFKQKIKKTESFYTEYRKIRSEFNKENKKLKGSRLKQISFRYFIKKKTKPI